MTELEIIERCKGLIRASLPCTPTKVIEKGKKQGLDPYFMRSSIWFLLDDGEIIHRDRCLEKASNVIEEKRTHPTVRSESEVSRCT